MIFYHFVFKRWLCWLLAPLLLFLPWPFIGTLNFFGNSDALFYSNVLSMTSDALKNGVIFPQWLPDANAGFGSPVMMFYAPLAYLITAILNLPFSSLQPDIGTQLAIGLYVSQVVSGFTCFLWLKRSYDERTAFTGSLLFVLLPYKLIYIYLHINLAQLWALALLPLWMMAAEDMIAGKVRAIGAYALCLAGVYYMHPLTIIAFAGVPAAYVLWFGRSLLSRRLFTLLAAHLLGALICIAQAVPGHEHLPWIHSNLFFSGNYNWRKNLFHVDVVLCAYYGMIAMLIGFAILRIPSLKQTPQARQCLFWIIILAGIFFLTQTISSFVWQALKPLQYLQFPAARLHAPALPAVIWLICFWLTHYKKMLPLGGLAFRRTTLLLLIVFFGGMTGWRVYRVESDPKEASYLYLEQGRVAELISTPVPLYVTHWDCIDARRAFELHNAFKVPPPVAIAYGLGAVTDVIWNPPDRIAFQASVWSPGGAVVAVRQCYWPLWQALNTITGQPVHLGPIHPDGLTALHLARGEYNIEIGLKMPREDLIYRWVSFLALAVALGLFTMKNRRFAADENSNSAVIQ